MRSNILITPMPFIRGLIDVSNNKNTTFYDAYSLEVVTSKWTAAQNGKTKEYNITLFKDIEVDTTSLQSHSVYIQIDDLSENIKRNLSIYLNLQKIVSISPKNFMFFGHFDISKDYVLKSPLFTTALNTFFVNALSNPKKIPNERFSIIDPAITSNPSTCCKTCAAISIIAIFIASGVLIYFSRYVLNF